MKKYILKSVMLLTLVLTGKLATAQYCINFNGSTDYITVPHYAALSSGTAVTVEAWIYATTWQKAIYAGSVVCTGNGKTQNNGFDLRAGANGEAQFNISIGGNWQTASSPAFMSLNTWYHLAGVFTGDSIIIYVDGVMKGATAITGSMVASTGALDIGQSPGYAGRFFTGDIDEVRVWNIARTQSELQSTICSSLVGNEPGLAGYWNFNNATYNGTTTAQNLSTVTGATNGTLTGYTTIANAWIGHDYTCTVSKPDVGVSAILTPGSGFNLTANQVVSVTVNNYSLNAISNIPVSYKIDSNTTVTETLAGPLPGFSSVTYNFTTTFTPTSFRRYNIIAFTGLVNDSNHINDTSKAFFNNYNTGYNFGVKFDGINSGIKVEDNPALDPTNALTVEAWINPSAWTNGLDVIVGKDGANSGYVLRCASGGVVAFQISDNYSWNAAASTPMLQTNRWYHVAGVYDGNTIKLYVDGALVSYSTAHKLIPSPGIPLMIGTDSFYASETFNGVIDEVRIWNVARTAAQIQANMTSSLHGTQTGLVAYYKLNEGVGAVADDSSGNAYNGALTGFTSIPGAWVNGFLPPINDMGVQGMIAPNSLTTFSGPTRVKFTIENYGFNTVSNIPVEYKINRGAYVHDTIHSSIAPNQQYTVLFNKIENLTSTNTDTFTLKVMLPGDTYINNDSQVTILKKPSQPNIIVAFDSIQHNFGVAGQTHYSTVIFPEAPEDYDTVLMHVSLGCPSTGCDPWDQSGQVFLTKLGQTFEIGRYITPYGIACGPWTIDVTDFKSLLVGQQTLQSYVQVWGGSGWLVYITFEFKKSKGQYPYSAITPLWNDDGIVYGTPGISYALPVVYDTISPKMKIASVHNCITGHGQGNTNNAAEFMQEFDSLYANKALYNQYLWVTYCSSNPCQSNGTWSTSRAGWCPGLGVAFFSNNVTANLKPGTVDSFRYALMTYNNQLYTGYNSTGHTQPFVRMHTYLIQASDSAHGFADFTDASSTRITSPINTTTLTASTPVSAVFKNTGTLSFTNPEVSYWINGVLQETDVISQTFNPGDSIIYSFNTSANLLANGTYTIDALITEISDNNATNDIATSTVKQNLGVHDLKNSIECSIMPNPSNGQFKVFINGINGKANVSVLDIRGTDIWNTQIEANTAIYEQDIDLQTIAKGVYFVKVQTSQGTTVQKITIQ